MRRLLPSIILLAALSVGITGCSDSVIKFPYADEAYVYPDLSGQQIRVFMGSVYDLRTSDQREGRGHFAGITFPGDDQWSRPVTDLYRDALVRDLTQTNLVELTPLLAQADYYLEAEVHSFHCRLERPATSFAAPVMIGSLIGFALGDDLGSRIKRAALLSVVSFGAIPMPAHKRSEVVVRLVLRNRDDVLIWERTCVGVIEGSLALSATARVDQEIAEQDLPLAAKRCNACLLGQLRQFLVSN